MQESERTYSSGYRFGFGGQEKDDEVKGEGNSYTAEYWEYDPRLGRRWNIDPITKPWESSYAAFANNPIIYTDPLGLDISYGDWGKGKIRNWMKATVSRIFSKKARQLFKKRRDDKTTVYQYNENREGDNGALTDGGPVTNSESHKDEKCLVYINYSKAVRFKGEFKFNTNVIDNFYITLNSDLFSKGQTGYDGTHGPNQYKSKGRVDLSNHSGWHANMRFGSEYNGTYQNVNMDGRSLFSGRNKSQRITFDVGKIIDFDITPMKSMQRNMEGHDAIQADISSPTQISIRLTSDMQTYRIFRYGPFGIFKTMPVLINFDANQLYRKRPGKAGNIGQNIPVQAN